MPLNEPHGGGSSCHVLFLQGPCSAFWRELGEAFQAAGHATHKIHVSLVDAIWWARPGATWYFGPFSGWRRFLSKYVVRNAITDIVYYADRQPYHVVAQEVAAAFDIRAVVIENGYLRPDWITVELGGMGVFSHFPADPETIRTLGAAAPQADLAVRYQHGFAEEMVRELLCHGGNCVLRVLHPFFRSGRYYNALFEHIVGIPHVLRAGRRARAAEHTIRRLKESKAGYYVVALQLQGDQQIQSNSPYRHLGEMIEEVVLSFARHAPVDVRLIFKQHPHDNGWENWPRRVAEGAARQGVGQRVLVVDGGDLQTLIAGARGCVLVNSTVGLVSLRNGCPTKVLGTAIYDMPGLTHQGSLDTFWTSPEPVDPLLADALERALAARIQVKGSFYNRTGRRAAIAEIVRRVGSGQVNGPDATVTPPPRLRAASRKGVRAVQ